MNDGRGYSEDELAAIADSVEIATAVSWWQKQFGCSRRAVAQTQKDAFGTALREEIVQLLRNTPYYARQLWEDVGIDLVSDYKPKSLLAAAARTSGIPCLIGYFPTKASVNVKIRLVTARYGSAAGRNTIYTEGRQHEHEEHPQ